MKIVRCSWFPPKGYKAILLVWYLIVKTNATITSKFINHEEIHEKQQKEMLIVFFFVWYALEFIVRLIQYLNWDKAYRNISFEREAYDNEKDLSYLKNRKRFTWIKYLKQ